MDKRIIAWVIVAVFLALGGYYLVIGNNTSTTSTTMQQITSTMLSSTTTRLITRPTQPGATTSRATTLSDATTTTTTLSSSTNVTVASSTTTTQSDTLTTQSTTTTPTTTLPGATTNPTTTTTLPGATSTTISDTTSTTEVGASTTSTTTLGTTTTSTFATTTIASTTTTTTTRTTTTTSTSSSTTTSTTQPPSSAPVLYLRFDESAGTTAYDSSLGGNDATLKNGPTWTTGRVGGALRLDGTNDYVGITAASSLNIYNSISIAAWIKPTAVTRDQDLVCKARQTSYTGYEFGLTQTGELFFRINPTASSYAFRKSSGAALAANVWQHVAATYDGTNIRFYKNGALINTVAAGGILYSATSDIFVGIYESETANQYGGTIDELIVYNRALSPTEISQIYSTAPSTTTTLPSTTTTRTTTTISTTTRTTTTVQQTTTTTTTTTRTTTTIAGAGSLVLSDYGIKADGSDETVKLQGAFDYAESHGYNKIIFPAGKTIGVSDTITFPGDMEYIGNGCTLYLLDDSYIIADSYYTFNYYTGDNVYIHHLIFDGNMNRQYRPTPPSGYYFPLRPNGGIIMYNNARFEYNEVKNYGGYMVEVSHGDNAVISHNLIHDGWQYGICTAGTDSDYSNNAVVTDNTIYRMGQVGIKIQHTSNSRFEGNTITIPGRYDLFSVPSVGSPEPTGIRLYSYDGPNNHLTITGNTIAGSGGNNEIAIQSDDSANTAITITNNQITNAYTGINIKFNNGIITGNNINYVNTCIANSGSGNTVTGNTCTP